MILTYLMGDNAYDYEPNYEVYKTLLLEMAQERSVAAILKMIVRQLARCSHIALARIWLIKEGDCPCPSGDFACDDTMRCLHLMASQGTSIVDESADWSRLDGKFSRFPIGSRKDGWISATGKAVEVNDIKKDYKWIARPEWARREKILGFGGQPLLYRGEILGVLAIFTRTRLEREELVWMRMIADHTATAVVNARAFEEIHRLQEHLKLECSYLREEVQEARAYGDIVGQSDALKNILRQIDLVAPTDAGVVILGESGTGKELVAREIHKRSQRHGRPLIKVNCAAISRELYESEFFGHAKGAFSGALKDRAGRFEAADGGTLFLDEVGEIPIDLQGKLLRVLQEGQYERVGEDVTRQVGVRVIAATNRKLEEDIDQGRFRQDLYYRLTVFPIEVPPLRYRKADIPLLTEHFLRLFQKRDNLKLPRVSASGLKQLRDYDWPGNVRELQNVIERAAIISRGGPLRFIMPNDSGSWDAEGMPAFDTAPDYEPPGGELSEDEPLVVPQSEIKRRERRNIIAALKKSSWKIYGAGGAAELLDVKPTTLSSRIKKMKIKKPDE